MIRSLLALVAMTVSLAALPAAPAAAVDGVIEINHTAALAGGVTPGDTPGYPVQLDRGGSFRLTSNLSGAIQVGLGVVDPVAIDLAGFAIDGGGGNFSGVTAASLDDVTVHGGIVRNFATVCVHLGDRARAFDLVVEGCNPLNPFGAITVGASSLVLRNVVDNGTDIGIQSGPGSIVADNLIEGPGRDGIRSQSGKNVVLRNSVREASTGIGSIGRSVVRGNLVANSSNGMLLGGQSVAAGNLVSSASSIGVFMSGDGTLIDNRAIAVVGTGASGLFCSGACQLSDNGATESTTGIRLTGPSNVCRGHAASNAAVGFHCSGSDTCHLVDIAAMGNATGLSMLSGTAGSYKGATLNANSVSDATPIGLDPGFDNSCTGTVPCP